MAAKITRPKLSRPAAIALAVIGVLLLALAGCQLLKPKADKDPYRTEAVTQGDLTRSVSASGTLQALVTVEVGSQISGQIRQVMVDFNDHVTRGQVMAVLDPQTYVSRAQQGRAEVSSNVASRNQAQAQADVARATYNRTRTLYDKGIVAKAALESAQADWKAAQAGVASANARINQAQAALASTNVDLSRTNVVAPITGIVVDRQIEPGQTVAASLSAPVLFRIAQDLSRMEVKINVDEADIGQVREGQQVRFTVDAFPDDNFTGVVTQVRKQPTAEQNVVAYTVIAEADNPGMKLLPGMTANADIVIEQKRNVKKVPAAALRWTPADETAQPPARGGFGGPPGMGGGGQRPQGARQGGGMNIQRLTEQLGLDAGQQKKVEPILTAARMKAAAASGDPQARRTAMRTAIAEAFTKIEPLLKADQKTKLVALRATMAAGGGRGGAGGMTSGVVWVLRDDKPTPVPVRVGATDGSFTEIVGALKVGDQVITGGGPKAKVKAATPFGGGQQPRIRM
jgi:HlyD family secretion protein